MNRRLKVWGWRQHWHRPIASGATMSCSTVPPDDARLDALRQEFEQEASFSQVFVVLTVGATLGLLANSPGVVIGAMVVAPWILPLQAMAFEILRGRLPMFLRALRTLMLVVVICVLLAISIWWESPSTGRRTRR
jgi:uncharacterized membrane protein